ncbi:MAG: DUF234 domain-containing protein [Anaerolineae bacterium]|nr:DUF234 domain-containing protein [Anaerolineae bacterium]
MGQTALEDLSRKWTAQAGRGGRPPFDSEVVGMHWSRRMQVDVVAANWRERVVLLGEYK